ncbi:MAG: hypothetical protein H6Q59_1509 [Firmicutes bacterium]|nr:hypothetical protein [Bacillota bacterium]
MNLYERLTSNRYDYRNGNSSFKFIDFMNTDMIGATDALSFRGEENAIRQIVRSVFSFQRYEPYNPYVFHKVIPSARNIHPNEAFLIEDGEICRFNPKGNCFEMIGFSERHKGKLWIVIASELWRIMKFYGEFGLALSLLDVGHIQAHLKLKLVAAGYEKAILLEGINGKHLSNCLGFSDSSACIGCVIDLSEYLGKSEEEPIPENYRMISYTIKRKYDYEDEIRRYPAVINFLKQVEVSRRVRIAQSEAAKKMCSVLRYELLRNSGHSTQGLFSTLDRIETDTVMRYATATAGYIREYLDNGIRFRICFLYRAIDGQNYLIQVSGEGILRLESLESVHRESLLHDTFEHINMNSIPLDVFILYQRDPICSEDNNIRQAHIGAGEISQYISLMAAVDGFFARPMKNFNDLNIMKLMGSDQESDSIIYTTIIGKENHYNYVFKLQGGNGA